MRTKLFIFFSVILVQKQNEQLLNEEFIFRAFLSIGNLVNLLSFEQNTISFGFKNAILPENDSFLN